MEDFVFLNDSSPSPTELPAVAPGWDARGCRHQGTCAGTARLARAEGLVAGACARAAPLSPLWSAVLIARPPTLRPKLRSPDTSSLAGGRRASEWGARASLGLLQPLSVLSSTAAKWSQCRTRRASSLAGTSACKCRDQKGLLRVGRPLCMTPDPGGRAGARE